MTTTPDTMFSGAELVTNTADDYLTRLDPVRVRLVPPYDYATVPNPRAARDEIEQALQRISGARAFLRGEHDRTYAGPWGPYTTLEGYREHYAADALRTALHHIVWAEHYAGIRDRDSAMALDPWRQ